MKPPQKSVTLDCAADTMGSFFARFETAASFHHSNMSENIFVPGNMKHVGSPTAKTGHVHPDFRYTQTNHLERCQ